MSTETTQPQPPKRRMGVKVALVTAGAAAGVIGATALGAHAATTSDSTSGTGSTQATASSSAPTSAPSAAPGRGARPNGQFNPGGAQPVRSDEKSVSSSLAATLKAAALKAVPGGTVIRVETDSGDAAYEVHMKKSDGSLVTVKFDKNLKETAVENGMGK